jgi:hypothetical protein
MRQYSIVLCRRPCESDAARAPTPISQWFTQSAESRRREDECLNFDGTNATWIANGRVYSAAGAFAFDPSPCWSASVLFFCRPWCGDSGGAVQQTRCDFQKHFIDSLIRQGGRLGEANSERAGQRLSLSSCHNPGLGEVGLGRDKIEHCVFAPVFMRLLQPEGNVIEGVLKRDVVYNHNRIRATIVGRADGAKTLLPGGVPNLELDCLAADGCRFDLEVDTDRREELLLKNTAAEPSQEA